MSLTTRLLHLSRNFPWGLTARQACFVDKSLWLWHEWGSKLDQKVALACQIFCPSCSPIFAPRIINWTPANYQVRRLLCFCFYGDMVPWHHSELWTLWGCNQLWLYQPGEVQLATSASDVNHHINQSKAMDDCGGARTAENPLFKADKKAALRTAKANLSWAITAEKLQDISTWLWWWGKMTLQQGRPPHPPTTSCSVWPWLMWLKLCLESTHVSLPDQTI